MKEELNKTQNNEESQSNKPKIIKTYVPDKINTNNIEAKKVLEG